MSLSTKMSQKHCLKDFVLEKISLTCKIYQRQNISKTKCLKTKCLKNKKSQRKNVSKTKSSQTMCLKNKTSQRQMSHKQKV